MMRRFVLVVAILYALGITGAALLNRWEVWPEANWQPSPLMEDSRQWLRGESPPQPATPECSLSME